jgi:ATP-dependent helicase YprA (DUF1998 family)
MNAIEVTKTLQRNYVRYLMTTFNVGRSEPDLAEALRRELAAPGALFRGPFLELNPPYLSGRSLRQLADDGIVTEALCNLRSDIEPSSQRPLPPDRLLYLHQERAIRHILAGRNLVVASGTGSGKTECFLLPVLHDLLTDPTPGVRALLIYPMNALVNDQLERLRNLLRGTGITFGRYTSELAERETEGRNKTPQAPVNEIVSRETIRGSACHVPNPPQILITNYAMLEYLLLRPQDAPLFNSGLWRFICLDEAHTYTGAQGIEVSLLLRRLKHRLSKQRGEIRCIATSATLIRDDTAAAARFAAHLFGEEFAATDVVFGESVDLSAAPAATTAASFNAWLQIKTDLYERLLAAANDESPAPSLLAEAAAVLDQAGLVDSSTLETAQVASKGEVTQFLWHALSANTQLAMLRNLMSAGPLELRDAGHALLEVGGETAVLGDEEERIETVRRLIEFGALARATKDAAPLLPARYHLFARGPQGVWLCLNPSHAARLQRNGWAELYLDKREKCEECEAGVLEMCACRNCGQPFVRAFEREGFFCSEGRYLADTSGQRYFTWRPLAAEAEELETEAEDTAAEVSGGALKICLRCRRRAEACLCQDASMSATLYPVVNRQGQASERLNTCPRCGTRATQKEVVTPVRLGSHAPLAVLTEDLYQLTPPATSAAVRSKPGEGRKLLTFADTRQGAARYAAYLQGTSDETLYRHLIARAAANLAGDGHAPDLKDLAEHCVSLAVSYGLYGEKPEYATPSQRRRWTQDATKRILAEFCTRLDPRHSLWAIGLVGCDVYLPEQIQPADSLCTRFGLSQGALLVVIQALLDTMRLDKAVALPDDVRAEDEVFGTNRAKIFYQLTGADGPNLRNWAGTDARQTRFDYVQRLLLASGRTAENADVRNALQAVWDWLQEQPVFAWQGAACQIRSDRLLFPSNSVWYRCGTCLKLTRRLTSETLRLCPTRGCTGKLESCEIESEFAEDHYRAIFSRRPLGMRVEEHTAQLQPGLGREYQEKFISGDINVLSCSTTFEMGVDVGDLQTVVLNNIPPTVANYRQRAGRAGRRASGTAFILTYAAPRPHDRLYFAEPRQIIAGEVAVPRLAISNRIITARHLNALLLGHFLRYLARQGRSELDRSGAFFAPNQPGMRHLELLEQWRAGCGQELEQLVTRFFTENSLEANCEVSQETPAACLNRLTTALHDRQRDFERWLSEYERLRAEYTSQADDTHDRREQQNAEALRRRFNALRQRLLDEGLIEFLCREGVLPSYSFPIDVVELRLPRGKTYRSDSYADQSLRLERDKKIAIVEYAPGAEVVADKHVWKSVGVVIQQALNTYEYRVCGTCRDLERSERGGLPISRACRVCGDSQPDAAPGIAFTYVDPDGFTTDLTAEVREAGLHVEAGVNRARSYLLAEGERLDQQSLPVNGPTRLSYSYQRDGQLVALNSGADPADGFWLCERCGRQVAPPPQRRGRKRQASMEHRTPWGEKCMGTPGPYHLGHDFKTDTLHLRFFDTANVVLPAGQETSFWHSLTYSLLAGASHALQIERRDLDGVVRPFRTHSTADPQSNYSQEVVLFDNVPGGAGHVRNIAENLEAVLRRALAVVQCADCTEETSCTSCLRNYDNQIYWETLQRGPVARFLESLLNEVFPEALYHLAAGAARVAAIDKTRWLIQQIAGAEQEVSIFVNRIAQDNSGGETRGWLDLLQDLLRRERKVSLHLREFPVFDRTQPTLASLRDHLRLLVNDYGLRLYLADAAQSVDWHILLDPVGERCRAIRVEDSDHWLHQRAGGQGLITTVNPTAVRALAEYSVRLPRRAVGAEHLIAPPEVRVLHIREGEQVSEAKLFGKVFHGPLESMHINDKYLRSPAQEKRLHAYLQLITTLSGQRSKVVIATLAAEIHASRPPYYQTSREQQQMLNRLQQAFPNLDLQLRLEQRLPHDRYIELVRIDQSRVRIAIGAGLDFIQSNGRARMTDIIIEDPYQP